jgi:galactose mutarotase-like enzyme
MTIAVEQRQYQTYILSDGDALIEVVPERGGIITRWQMAGQELLYLDSDRFTHPDLSVRGGIPILFPICGNLPNNTYQYGGQSYSLPQHGFGRELPWQVVSTNPDAGQIVLSLHSNDATRTVYPFEFELTFTYTLKGNTITLHQRLTNHSATILPFSVGFHPYFSVMDKSKLQLDLPSTQYQDRITGKVIDFGGSFDYSVAEIDAAFQGLSNGTSHVMDRDRNLRLTMNTSPEFSTLVFWTVQGKDFYCLEPWTAGRNAINTGIHLLNVQPHTSLETECSFAVEFI